MLLSKSCIYGLRASLYVATLKQEEYFSIRKISEDLEISFHFLTKILQQLTHADLMESFRGPNGGIRLKRGSDEITLLEIVEAIDGKDLLRECALGLPECGKAKPCPIHHKWAKARDAIREMLEGTTLAELAHQTKAQGLRLTDSDSMDRLLTSRGA